MAANLLITYSHKLVSHAEGIFRYEFDLYQVQNEL